MEDGGGMEIKRQVCIEFPPMINSCGFLGCGAGTGGLNGVMKYSSPGLFLQMSFILISFHMLHRLLNRLLLPALFSQVVVGTIMGQLFVISYFPEEAEDSQANSQVLEHIKVIGTLTSLGYIFFLFLNGVKVDPTMVLRDGRRPLLIAVASVVGPVTLDMWILRLVGLSHGNMVTNRTFPLAVAYVKTSFPVIHCLLSDLKILNSELGRLGMSAAIISDLFSQLLIMISFFIQLVATASCTRDVVLQILKDSGGALAIAVGVLVMLRRIFKWLLRHTTPDGARVKDEFVYLIIVLFLYSPGLAANLHTLILVAPLFLGLAVPEGPQVGAVLLDKFDSFVSGLVLPLCVAISAARADLKVSVQKPIDEFMTMSMLSAIIVLLVKFGIITVIVPLSFNVPLKHSLALSLILCTKGVVELATFTLMNETRFIPQNVFAFNLVLVVLIATITPIIVKFLYDPTQKYAGYAKRSIRHSNAYDEIRMLVCIHVPSNVISTINLLGNFYPNRGSGMTINVLHLVKLCNKSMPVFIAHQKHRKAVSGESAYYPENIITSFESFERDHKDGVVNVHVFTSVSPPKLIHEDICNLAFDKLTSLIILPFHRRRLIDGTIELDDSSIRNINCTMLGRSPCSVGIFVEGKCHLRRSHLRGSSPDRSAKYQLAVIFLGGSDDREALTIATRLCQNMCVQLTVVHLKAAYRFDSVMQKYEEMYDDEVLRTAKENLNVSFIENEVNEGNETATFLRPLVHGFDLIIVGRRYKVEDVRTVGVDERNEFPELGIIGDLLASKDFNGEYSVLVVQQQRTKHERTKPKRSISIT